jgi:hypothetical protein
MSKELHQEFENLLVAEEPRRVCEAIAVAFDTLLTQLEEYCPLGGGRQLALARTKLEEACFFAKKASVLEAPARARRAAEEVTEP